METDISKTTIMILLVFTIVISVMGTFTVLESLNAPRTVYENGETSPAGSVQLSITPPRTNNAIGPANTEASVQLGIEKGGE